MNETLTYDENGNIKTLVRKRNNPSSARVHPLFWRGVYDACRSGLGYEEMMPLIVKVENYVLDSGTESCILNGSKG